MSWSDPATVAEYLDRHRADSPRAAGERLLLDCLPTGAGSVLDLGCGDGRLADLAITRLPHIERVLAVDRSEPMLAAARHRLRGHPMAAVRSFDLDQDIRTLGSYDVILSGLAIHHLTDERKRALYAEAAACLNPGGLVANLGIVTSGSPALHAQFLTAIGRVADDPEDRLAPLDQQLDWLRAAGLVDVDCLWKWRGFALLMGRRPAQ